MNKKLLIVAATGPELELSVRRHDLSYNGPVSCNGFDISILSTGIGSVNTVWSLMNYCTKYGHPDYILNIGIAGSFKEGLRPGESVIVADDCFADLGLETPDGHMDLFEAGFVEKDEDVFTNRKVLADKEMLSRIGKDFRAVSGITVNMASGSRETISRLEKKFNADIETMEGAAIYFTAAKLNIPALSLRSISNMVEPRNRDSWKIDLALKNLSDSVTNIIESNSLI